MRLLRFVPAMLITASIAIAQTPTPPSAGGPQPAPGRTAAPDAGPASQPPRTDSPQAVNRGTDGSAAGLTHPGATGATPQGMMGSSTAGARDPHAPVGGHPPRADPCN